MARDRTWNVMRWAARPSQDDQLILHFRCPHCSTEATLPVRNPGVPIHCTVGLGVVFDDASFKPDAPIMPDEIQCRSCRKIFSQD